MSPSRGYGADASCGSTRKTDGSVNLARLESKAAIWYVADSSSMSYPSAPMGRGESHGVAEMRICSAVEGLSASVTFRFGNGGARVLVPSALG